MKKSLTFILLFISVLAYSQNTGINFQGVGRNSSGAVLASTKISLRFSVIQTSETGTVEYVESKEVTTNAQGIFSVVIGDGTQISKTGNFSDINWKINPKFLKVEMDPAGGTSFVAMGTTRLQSVPFAYYANGVNADNVDGVLSASKGGTGVASISALKSALTIDQINNTSDLAKPISTATQTALDTKVDKVDGKQLSTNDFSTLEKTKLSAVSGTNTGDQDLSGLATISQLNTKANTSDLALKANTSDLALKANASDLALKANTSDLALKANASDLALKANAADLALKAPIESPTFTGTVSGITKSMVGLSNVENTADLAKPINTLTQAALDTKISASSLSSTFSSKENSDNKSMATDLGGNTTNDILFPTQKAVKSYVDAQINSGGVQDGGILTRHLADGAVSGIKLASEISGFKRFVDGAGSVTLSSTITTDVDVNAGNLAIGGTSNWQSFTAGSSGKLSSIEFQTVNPSSSGPAPVAYVEIYNGQGLSGALLGTSANFPISGMGRNWYAFDLGSTSISLVGGSVYTARLVVNTSNQNYVYGDNALYNGGISNISSNWDFNIKTKMRQFSNDTFLTTSAANGLYGSLVSNATHTGEVTGATALTITDGAVTSAKIANSAVDLTTKVTGVLPTTNIADGAITNAKIANSAVDLTTKVTGVLPTANVADGAITTAKIANSAVDLTTKVTGVLPTANVADGAITTAKIANSAVDLATKVTGVLPTANGGTGTLTATANTFFAAPNGANGAPIFRSLVASDLPTLTSSYIANNSSTPQSANINIAGDAVIVGTISASSAIFSNTTAGSSIVGTLSSGQDITVNGKTIGSGAGNKITNAVFGKDALISNTTGEWNTAIGLETLKNNKNGSNNTAIGKFSLHDNISGSNNTAIGEESMYKNTIGANNYAHGYLTLYSNTSGSFNIVNGTNALVYNTTGSSNIAYGVLSMFNSISGNQNVAIGNMTLNDNISGSNNVAIGKESFKNNTTGSNNTAIGALTNVSSGTLSNSTAIGYGAIVDESNKIQLGNTNVLKVNTSGVFSAASIQNTPIGSTTRNTGAFTMLTSSSDASIGGTLTVTGVTTFTSTPVLLSSTASRALFTNNNKQVVSNNITGTGDVVMSIAPTLTGTITLESLSSTSDITVNGKKIGRGAGNNSTSTVFGLNALVNNTDGYNNNAIGDLALQKNTIGNNNTAIGYNALNSNTSGSNNIANGNSTLLSNTTGSNNIANGIGALERNTSGNSNIANGTNVLLNNLTGSDNIANGHNTLFSNTSGSRNIANGSTALYFNTTGNDNFASGVGALKNNNADYNIAIGNESLNNNTSGSNNIAYGNEALWSNTSGSHNIALGDKSLLVNQSGLYNIAIGSMSLVQSSGNQNIAIGAGAGSSTSPYLTTGSNNIIIGTFADVSNSTVSNEITLGNSSITKLRSMVTSITSLSDRRDKTDIVDISEGIDLIKQLKPVTFTWNTRDKAKVGLKSAGFIAQDLLALQKASSIGANLDLVSEDNPDKLEARYNNLLPVMVKAMQDQQVIIEELKKELEVLKKLIQKN
jgi:hypothetical protein